MNFNYVVKRIHFFASIVLFFMALMYAATAVIMTQPKIFEHGEPTTTNSTLAVPFVPDTTDLQALGEKFKDHFGLSGRMTCFQNWKKEIVCEFVRPGILDKIVVRTTLDSLSIQHTERVTVGEISTRIHRLHGFNGGWRYVAWAVLLDITAIAMIVFAITGVLIWLKMHRQFRFGWPLLGMTTAFSIYMFFYLL